MIAKIPKTEFLSKWLHVVNDLEKELSENEIVEKYKGQVSKASMQLIKRILRNQLHESLLFHT